MAFRIVEIGDQENSQKCRYDWGPLFDSMMVIVPEVAGAADNMISSQTDDFYCSLL